LVGGRSIRRVAVQLRPADDALRALDQDVAVSFLPSLAIPFLDEQPVRAPFLGGAASHADEHPGAAELLAVKLELEPAAAEAFVRVFERLPGAAVPDDHLAGAVFAARDAPLEAAVLERVIFDLDREALLAGVEARAL